MKVNPKTDRPEAYPAGTYGPEQNATLERLYIGPSRFEERDKDGNPILGDDGEPVRPDVLKADLTFDYVDSDGNEKNGRLTQQFDRYVEDTLRNLSGDNAEWVDKLPRDEDGSFEVPTDDEGTVLIDGVAAENFDVQFTMTARKRGDRVFNNATRLRLA